MNQCRIITFETLYCRRQNLDAVFLIDVFKNKVECSLMNTVGIRIPTKQIREFSTLKVGNVSRRSARCVTAANNN